MRSVPSYRATDRRSILGDVTPSLVGQSHRGLLASLSRNEAMRLHREPQPYTQSRVPFPSREGSISDLDYVPFKKTKKHKSVTVPRAGRSIHIGDGKSVSTTEVTDTSSCSSSEEDWLDDTQTAENRQGEAAHVDGIGNKQFSYTESTLSNLAHDNPRRISAWLQMLDEGNGVWNARNLLSEWNEIAVQAPSNVAVQSARLRFFQSNFMAFSYETCRHLYSEYIALLQTIATDPADRIRHSVETVLRFTNFARSAGYTELSTGLWQAWFHVLSGPQPVDEFWEGEGPRIGDEELLDEPRIAVEHNPRSHPGNYNDPLSGSEWFALEQSFCRGSKMPRRTTDDDIDDDPESIILFSDVKPFIIAVGAEHASVILNAFACFESLPPLLGPRAYQDRAWWSDVYLRVQPASNGSFDPFEPLPNQVSTLYSLFEFDWVRGQIPQKEVRFIRSVLHSLVWGQLHFESLPEYYLAFVFHTEPTAVKKEGRALLKKHPSNLRLYSAYALVESKLGDKESSARILTTAVKMSKALTATDHLNEVHLRLVQLWQTIQSTKSRPDLEYLDVVFEYKPDRSQMKKSRDAALRSGVVDVAVTQSECIILFEYLAASGDLAVSTKALKEEIDIMSPIGIDAPYAIEVLFQSYANLVDHHMKEVSQMLPPVVRKTLRTSVEEFSNNMRISEVVARYEKRFIVEDRLRDSAVATSTTSDRQTVVSWTFETSRELSRFSSSKSTLHSARALFERAVASRAAMHSEIIWTAYLKFELKQGQKERAKAVFYRGMANLPWSKTFTMLAFEDLGDFMTTEEQRSIYQVMQDKELRIRYDWT